MTTRMILLATVSVLALTGCEGTDVGGLYDPKAKEYSPAYVFMNPLCLFICPSTMQSSGSQVANQGGSATVSGSQSSTQGVGE